MTAENTVFRGEDAVRVTGLGEYSLSDTLECGQCFRFAPLPPEGLLSRYALMTGGDYLEIGQEEPGSLLLFNTDIRDAEGKWSRYLALDLDLAGMRRDILSRSSSEWLAEAAKRAGGIAILRQDPWETLFSFIVSQNNFIPRITKILRRVSYEYGHKCQQKVSKYLCTSSCEECGLCYSFPSPEDILASPEKLLLTRPGFRYEYLLDAARAVAEGRVDLAEIARRGSAEYTVSELRKIRGVGLKVASCVALFAFGNYEAFPVDVWMKRAIDKYFDGKLDPHSLGSYAGIAQQYIFHYIRNGGGEEETAVRHGRGKNSSASAPSKVSSDAETADTEKTPVLT